MQRRSFLKNAVVWGSSAYFGSRAMTRPGSLPVSAKRNMALSDYKEYDGLLKAIIRYFEAGVALFPAQETKEIYVFMSAFKKSKRLRGKPVPLQRF